MKERGNIYLTAVSIILFAASLRAQTPKLSFANLDEMSMYINDAFVPGDSVLSKLCVHTAVFMKFNFDRQGQLADIDYTSNTPVALLPALSKAVNTLSGSWELSQKEKKRLAGMTFLQPLLLYYDRGCLSNYAHSSMSPEELDKYLERNREAIKKEKMEYDQVDNAIFDMLNFKHAGRIIPSNCTILVPLRRAAH